MKKIVIALIAATTLSMSVSAHASQSAGNEQKIDMDASCVQSNAIETMTEKAFSENDDITVQIAETEQMDAHKPGEYDDKYYADYEGWCKGYERRVELFLGIITNELDPERKTAINPKRIEPWWDEWIAEMLAEGLIEQSWYDDMIAKGYIIEVD